MFTRYEVHLDLNLSSLFIGWRKKVTQLDIDRLVISTLVIHILRGFFLLIIKFVCLKCDGFFSFSCPQKGPWRNVLLWKMMRGKSSREFEVAQVFVNWTTKNLKSVVISL